MELRPLAQDEISALRRMVEEGVDLHLQSSSPQFAFVPGACYDVDWSLGCLDAERLERVRWLLGEIGFVAGAVESQLSASPIPHIQNNFFTLTVQRRAAFLPDCLWGEALVIESVACSWDAHVERFGLANDLASRKRAFQNQYGPMGGAVA